MNEQQYKQFKQANRLFNYCLMGLLLYFGIFYNLHPEWFLYQQGTFSDLKNIDFSKHFGITDENKEQTFVNCDKNYVAQARLQKDPSLAFVTRFMIQSCVVGNLPQGKENMLLRGKNPFLYWVAMHQLVVGFFILIAIIIEHVVMWKRKDGTLYWLHTKLLYISNSSK